MLKNEYQSINGTQFAQTFRSRQHGDRVYTFLLGTDPGINDDFVILRTHAPLETGDDGFLVPMKDMEKEHHSIAIPADIFLRVAEWLGSIALPMVKNLVVIEWEEKLYAVLEWTDRHEEVVEFPPDIVRGEEVGEFIRAYLGV